VLYVIPVDPDRTLILGRGEDLGEIEPRVVPGGFAVAAFAKEQNVDDDGAGLAAEAALRQADRADEGDVFSCGRIRLVQRTGGRDEGGAERGRSFP